MNNFYIVAHVLIVSLGCLSFTANADPQQDLQAFRAFYFEKFTGFSLQEYANGVYMIDPDARESWQAIEEFPPYELAIEGGEALFNNPFNNGKTYADCFSNRGIGIANRYPQWDKNKQMVMTLPSAINDCRMKNGEEPLDYKKGTITEILAYMAYTSRGKPTNISIPSDEPKALAAYKEGKQFYYARRGQLNFSCATCHIQNTGLQIRAETLSPALGHTTGWPVYRLKWLEMGTLHRRFAGCNKQIRAKPFKAQSQEYRNLEYFLSFMSNGIYLNGPSTRK